jgi:hypothetical protein
MATEPLPPNDSREVWIKRNAAALRRVLSEPTTRTRLLELLNGKTRPGANDESD